ncbi:TonB-dependent siderophore receptor [Rhizobium sp. S152]|uniref:TonB-dependent siderophore receptor n=1 Tax=Rhizobium sp. S152 TaxID=3055038 RepID=UPI0025A9BF02|nr:TonB-dependent siderophore receptor [Rhizobium sp. S152]MDM9627916.1 TonB-dependent siderophore receptor [Rhizobium sp. S152]
MGIKANRLSMRTDLLAGAAMSALVATGAFAQEATELKPVVIQGQGAGNATDDGGPDATGTSPIRGYVAKTTTTGSKTATPLNEVPQSVSVIGRQELDDRGITNKVDEALLYTPGVMAQPYGNDPDTDWFYIRGFNATQTGVFFDNLTLFSYGFGGFQIDPFMLERVEVLKGPASVLLGGSNPGGVINLVRKRPTDEPLFYTDIGINSNGNAFTGIDISDKVGSSDTMTYRFTGKIAGGDNYSDFSHDLRGFIMPQLTISPDDTTSLTLWGYAGGLDQVHTGNGFFPYYGTVENASFGKIKRDAFFGEPDIDKGVYSQQMLGYEFEHELDNGWKLSQNFRYGHLYKHEEGPYLNGYTDATQTQFARIGFEGRSKVDTFAIDNRAENEFEFGGVSHNLMLGLDYKYYLIDDWQACCGATPISTTDPVYGVPQGANFVYANAQIRQQQLGLYAQDQIHFGDGWLLTLNGRYDFVDAKSDAVAGASYHSNDNAASGRAGLAYEFDNGITPYASVATFFNPIIGTRQTDPVDTTKVAPLVPEEGYQVEAGVKYEPTFIDGSVTASVFQIVKENAAVPNPSNFNLTEQLGEVTSKGFELEAKINLDQNWKVLGSYSYTHLEITDDPNPALVGNTPFIVPAHQASLWLDYAVTNEALEGLSFGAGVRYQGTSWANNENTNKVPAATVFDAAIRYEKENWQASLNVANLFDKEYVASCGGLTVCGYGDARTVTFKLSKKW